MPHRLLLALVLITTTPMPGETAQRPDPVPPLVERRLERADYVELARRWQAWIEDHENDALAHVHLARAHDYAGELDAALEQARRAVAIDARNPLALGMLGKLLAALDDDAEALELLRACRSLAPNETSCLHPLVATHLRRGEIEAAMEVAEVLFEQNLVPRPLLDFGYNLLAGLPEGAVLITSGDNDTFPALALQAGHEFRRDVLVLNRSLLNLPAYFEGVFAARDDLRPDVDPQAHPNDAVSWDGDKALLLSTVTIEALIAEAKAPIHIAPTAAHAQLGYEPKGEVEGLTLRASGKAMPAEDAARLFLGTYRLDSATDWTFAWNLMPAARGLMRNYVATMMQTATELDDAALRRRMLERAATIAEFHAMQIELANVKAMLGE